MQEFIEIGPIMLPVHWLYWGLSSLGGYLMIVLRLNGSSLHKKRIVDTLINGAIIALLSWKFSYLLFHPVYAFSNPISILYFDGGSKGVLISLFTASLYLVYQSFNQKTPFAIYIELLFVGVVGWSIVFHFIHIWSEMIYSITQVIIGITLLGFLYKSTIGHFKKINNFIIVYSLIQILLQYFTVGAPFVLHFTLLQVIYILVILILLITPLKGGNSH
ncbi:hypothetical protein [Bacillus alkalisoli]|uniref:hypothetical protein n=1 Tax=Bacillus alkalisoli TaxID=2011008 RepID=UPI000C24358C|nr:hypothetical protein [Bacillus alkalisoli]